MHVEIFWRFGSLKSFDRRGPRLFGVHSDPSREGWLWVVGAAKQSFENSGKSFWPWWRRGYGNTEKDCILPGQDGDEKWKISFAEEIVHTQEQTQTEGQLLAALFS